MTPALTGLIFAGLIAAGGVPNIARAQQILRQDRRVLADRLNPARNPGKRDESFLDAVGAVWPYAIEKHGAGYAASTGERSATGFLIDRCHVLTNLHVVYGDPDGVDPPIGRAAAFAVGQTPTERDRGALQGLRMLAPGRVIAQGDARMLGGRMQHPEDDWALIRLTINIDGIVPMTVVSADRVDLAVHREVWSAGYPSDHRLRRGEGFKLKDLWVSEGEVVGILEESAGLLMQSTLQTTHGNSGGPVYVTPTGRRPVVIGMVQSSWGNGIDRPNIHLLFTQPLMARITAARLETPCMAG